MLEKMILQTINRFESWLPNFKRNLGEDIIESSLSTSRRCKRISSL
jgi:hypothetical protein